MKGCQAGWECQRHTEQHSINYSQAAGGFTPGLPLPRCSFRVIAVVSHSRSLFLRLVIKSAKYVSEL